MPGLIDARVHAAITTMNLEAMQRKPLALVPQEVRHNMELMLRRGFSTVRDAGGAPALCGCQIHLTGFSHVVDGVPALRKAAREELRRCASV